MPYERSPTQRNGRPPSRLGPRYARVYHDHDHHGGDECYQREAAPEEKRLRFVEPEAEPDESAQGGEAQHVGQQRGGSASRPVTESPTEVLLGKEVPWRPHEG